MKRFYKEALFEKTPEGFEIRLDGKPVKTPAGRILNPPCAVLAEQIAAEWQTQKEDIDPDTMPLTQMLTTALDRVAEARTEISQNALNYLDTDLLCYRADQPPAVRTAQEEAWDKWLSWFAGEYGLALKTTTGLGALKQPAAAHEAATRFVDALDDARFTVLQLITAQAGSLVLALAFVQGAITPDELFEVTHVEERLKAEIYNEDFYGAAPHEERNRAALKRDFVAARRFLDAL